MPKKIHHRNSRSQTIRGGNVGSPHSTDTVSPMHLNAPAGDADNSANSSDSDKPPASLADIFRHAGVRGNDILLFLSFFSPTIISISVLLLSIFSASTGKGVFFIFWVMFFTMIRIAVMWGAGAASSAHDANSVCNLSNVLPYDNASYSLYIMTFTAMYFILPMFMSNNPNYVALAFFVAYVVLDIAVKTKYKCVSPTELITTFIAGGALGSFVASMVYLSPVKSYLFINETGSNKVSCSMPSKQQFKCTVYKNGEIVGSSIKS
jgi:hypothetical protein